MEAAIEQTMKVMRAMEAIDGATEGAIEVTTEYVTVSRANR